MKDRLAVLLSAHLPGWMKVRLRRIAYFFVELAERLPSRRDVPLLRSIPLVGIGDGTEIGESVVRQLVTLADLNPSDSVLDVGCGTGRVALPLTRYLRPPSGRYAGFDVEPEAIRWCEKHICRHHPHFTFEHVAVSNPNYYTASRPSTELRFPYRDAQFDVVLVTSVFTHMLQAEVVHYLSEIRRVLRPHGRVFATFFLLNEESEGLIAEQQGVFEWHDMGGYRTLNPRLPQSGVAYPENQVREWIVQHGLVVRDVVYGSWCGRTGRDTGQDIVVGVKAGPESRDG